ncbi:MULTISPECIES: IgaA/UmoB family intracellular growth attenuator, partial [unclassified Vibrio]
MNNFILIISLIIAIVSLVALISFKAEKDTAKSKLESLPQDLQPTRHTTFAERNALKTKFNFEPKDTQVYEIIGEISKSVLKKNGFATEQFFTINGYLVDIPYTAQPYLQPEENIVEVIYENDEAWLISLNNVWYITEDATEQKNRELNHKKIHNAEIGQLKESNIKITGKREANASEHQQLKPTGLGMGSMIAVLLNMCLFLLLFDSRYPALATATSLFLLPLNYWLFIRMRRAHSKPVMVTKMNGKIYSLEESGDELLVYFQPPQLTMASSYAYYAPIKWKKELERKIDHFVNFEVYPEREKLVSIDKNLSLAADQPEARPQVTPHVSMLIAILIFAQIAFNMVEKPIFDASLQQIWHERKITANGASELLEQHPNIGEKVVLSGHRQCLKTEKNHWDGFDSVLCQRFYLLDHALPTLSVPDSVE